MRIAQWLEDDCIPPPIGAVGTITEPADEDGDYFVVFEGYPWAAHDPGWFTPLWAVVPIAGGCCASQLATEPEKTLQFGNS